MTPKTLVTCLLLIALASPVAADAQGCALERRTDRNRVRNRTSVTDDGEKRLSVLWQQGDCELLIEARGEFTVRPDLTAVTRIDEGGFLDIEERDGRRERKVRITSRAGTL